MNLLTGTAITLLACLPAVSYAAKDDTDKGADSGPQVPRHLKDEASLSSGTLTIGGKPLTYSAEAGILVVYLKDPMDCDAAPEDDDSGALSCGEQKSGGEKKAERGADKPRVQPEAGMSYYAYFLGKQTNAARPITFIYNGGPGSSTIWLHMGAFGPKRVVTSEDSHTPGAPYRLVDNDASLLPESDLVFIDAPSTGFGHLRGSDKEKAFFGVDQDAHAFANFIVQFLSRHGRWNSPKYLFGESYGTTRSAVLTNVLQQEKNVDLNGVILLSQILSFDNSPDGADMNPGVDQPYALALPTYAATAWYHKRLPNQSAELEPFIKEVEDFAMGEYWNALAQGSALAPERRAAVIEKLHAYTGLPADYIARADLRITGGVFEQHVLDDRTAGRIDTRFSGPTIDLLAKEANYDPQAEAISSAFVSTFNEYVRHDLGFGSGRTFKPNNYAGIGNDWDFRHKPPDEADRLGISTNVMPDLAHAMKANPQLKVQLNSGYYDLATPYFAAEYEFKHLQIPADVAKNLELRRYKSGHMVYLHDASRHELHDNVADFIRRTHVSN